MKNWSSKSHATVPLKWLSLFPFSLFKFIYNQILEMFFYVFKTCLKLFLFSLFSCVILKSETCIEGLVYTLCDNVFHVNTVYVPGDDIMHFTDSSQFRISSAFKFTALCTILPHCVQSYRTGALKGRGWALKPLMYWTTEPGWLAYLGPMYIKLPMDVLFIRPCT